MQYMTSVLCVRCLSLCVDLPRYVAKAYGHVGN
jgi:hypothetical protein